MDRPIARVQKCIQRTHSIDGFAFDKLDVVALTIGIWVYYIMPGWSGNASGTISTAVFLAAFFHQQQQSPSNRVTAATVRYWLSA